jgi:hypothetical protein
MSEARLRELLETLQPYVRPAPYGPHSLSLNMGLHFTGGEPFLNFDLLRRAVEIATELEIPSLFVETNGFWGRNEQRAREMLRELKEAGLVGLLISVNPFFLEYVPFEATDTAIQVAHEVFGRHLMVYQLDYYARFTELGITGTMPFGEYLEREGREQTFGRTEFFLNGRSPFRMEEFGIFPHRPARGHAAALGTRREGSRRELLRARAGGVLRAALAARSGQPGSRARASACEQAHAVEGDHEHRELVHEHAGGHVYGTEEHTGEERGNGEERNYDVLADVAEGGTGEQRSLCDLA